MSKYTGKFPVIVEYIDNGQKIGEMANKLAYPNNPEIAQWPYGAPTAAYREALNKYKSYHTKSDASIAGASCDVFVCTSVRASGVDSKFPAGLWDIYKYLRNSDRYEQLPPTAKLQNGDIILYRKKPTLPRAGHVCLYFEGKCKEASAKHFYGRTTDLVKNRLDTTGKKFVYIFRIKDSEVYTPLKKGAKGLQVKRLQKYVNWYFADEIKVGKIERLVQDGIFGPLTESLVKKMQKEMKLKADGVVGKLTLSSMKNIEG